MRPSHASSLLVAALVLLRHPCTRNKASARLLLDRAAGHDSLTPVEREACRNLADDLDIESEEKPPVRAKSPAAHPALTDWGEEGRQHRVAALAFPNEPKGATA